MNNHFWKNKKVLITGFEGFLGSNLTKKLIYVGAKVVGVDIKTPRKKTILSKADYGKIIAIKGNVSSLKLINTILKKYKIDIVMHLAAEAIVGKSLKNPARTFDSNIKGTWTLLEACKNHKEIQAIVIASSDKAYGIHKKLPYKEDCALQGIHPYDVSKSCADLIANTYAHTFGMPVAVTRCGNIFGPGDFNFSRIVPDTIRSVLKNKTLNIRSNGKFTRDYVHVDDIVNGYILLAEQLKKKKLSGEAFNFSAEKPLSVLQMVDLDYTSANKKPNYKILNKAEFEIPDQYLS